MAVISAALRQLSPGTNGFMAPSQPAMVPFTPICLYILLAVAGGIYLDSIRRWKKRRCGLSLPPGPPRWPLIGNWFDMPQYKPWVQFKKMRLTYGDVFYLKVLNQGVLVIGSAQLAIEMLEKRSANSSDRPDNTALELSGQEFNMVFMPYGQRWRQHRRIFWQHFRPAVISKYYPIQQAETRRFLARLLQSPLQLKDHIRILFSGIMLKIVFDIDVINDDDEHITMLDDAMEAVSLASPGSFLVERLPFLRHVPSWVPGAGFQKILARSKAANHRLINEPFDQLKESLKRGGYRACIAADMITSMETQTESFSSASEDELKNVCTFTFEAASDTSFSMLQAIFVALALHPDVQKKAQDELDTVVGPNRLPNHDDSDALVYVNALIKEILRWHIEVPLSIPHRTIRDDHFHGYFIPAGTVVLPNVWDIMHDPEVYEDPDEFRPERFIREGKLDPSVQDPAAFSFGFGRRICPGRSFAHTSLFIAVACVLQVFDIGLPLDEHGETVPLKYEQSHGLLSYPEDCRCSMKPRSSAAAALAKIQGKPASV
ncbi:CyP450 monooxygenase [Lenzites betulinus]|nr:CyP450 monooxygenase [Lenzites betulinus]